MPKIRMTDQQVVDAANSLAHRFYAMHGNQRPETFKFYEATHPQEVLMWRLAGEAMLQLRGTDVDDALMGVD